MELLLYPKLGTVSRRVLTRRTRKGQTYTPQQRLLERLANESGLTMGQVWAQLEAEREYLLTQDSFSYLKAFKRKGLHKHH